MQNREMVEGEEDDFQAEKSAVLTIFSYHYVDDPETMEKNGVPQCVSCKHPPVEPCILNEMVFCLSCLSFELHRPRSQMEAW